MMAASALASSLLKGGGAGGHSGDLHSPPRRQAGGGGYLPLDTVHVSPRRISPAKLRQRWGVACRACNGLLMALGLWLAATSWGGSGIPYSVGAQATGLGLAISALGGVGLFAGGSEALGLRTLLLVGLGGSAVGTLDLMRQVGRDVSTHCSLAEVSARVRHVESALEKMKHDELITQLFFRMNEMDDMLGMVTQSAAATAEGHSAVWRAAQADRDYLRAKATALRRHAASVAESLKGRIEAGKANQTDAKDAGNLSDSLWGIERRVQAVDSVIRYLDSKEAAGDLTYEEYEIILEALLEGSSGHVPPTTVTLLQDEKTSLGSVKAAYERHTAQDYGHVMAAGGGGGSAAIGAITNAQARKESSRKHFENRFSQLFERHASARGPGGSFGASLRAVIDTLPEHCVRDVDAAARLHWLGWALLAAQLGGGWAALTAFVHVARKEE